MVNNRREFFRVSLDEIINVVKENYDKTVDFKKIPEAQQYRESLKIMENIEAHPESFQYNEYFDNYEEEEEDIDYEEEDIDDKEDNIDNEEDSDL